MKKIVNMYLIMRVASVNLLSICTGSALTWSSPVIPKLYSSDPDVNPLGRPITVLEESWLGSIINMGSAIGAVLSSLLSERYGRKKTMLAFSLAMLTANILIAFGNSVGVYLFARLLVGIGSGCVFSSLPNFVGELSEDFNRGLLGSFMGVFMCIGALISYSVGPFVSIGTLCFVHLIPLCLFYPLVIMIVPESPYYYLSITDNDSAQNSLKRIRLASLGAQKKELSYIKEFLDEQRLTKPPLKTLMKTKTVKRGLWICCGLMVFQQFSGITPVAAFLETIFEASGSSIQAQYAVIIVGVVQLIATSCSGLLVDRLGRKILLIISTTGCTIASASLGTFLYLKLNQFDVSSVTWLPIVSLMCFMICYNLGLGPLPWTILGEVFSSNIKSFASCLASVVGLCFAFLVTIIFPYMLQSLGMPMTFWCFSVCCVASIIFTVLMIPETKGRSLREIQELLKR